MDDITPLQQLNTEVVNSNAYLFSLRPAYRFRNVTGIQSAPNDLCVGKNPPYGASINYYLKSEAKQGVKITILDEKGQTIRSLTGSAKAGINRAWWDLRYEAPRQAKLRTKPAGNPHVWEEKRFKESVREGWMPLVAWGIESGLEGPLAVPGTYAVKISVNGQELSQKLTVKKDPNSAGTEADIQAQVRRALEIRDNLNTVVDSINRIEWIRKQIADLTEVLKGDKGTGDLIPAASQLDEKILAVEDLYFHRVLAEGDEKSFRVPLNLYGQLSVLAGDIAGGSADFPPTDQQVAVHEELKKELASAEKKLSELIAKDIAGFNNLLKEKNIPNIITK
jgi:hypothetical protein